MRRHYAARRCLASLVAALTAAAGAAAQERPGGEASFDLRTLFEAGNLVVDENGDSVPDRLGATLVLPPSPSDAERVAAAEITARLGFETMSLDLPLRRGVEPGRVGLVIGSGGAAEVGLTPADFGVESLDAEAGEVAVLERDGSRWLAVLGGDDRGLLRAARLLSGRLPHTRDMSSPSLDDVADELARWLMPDTAAARPVLRFTRAEVRPDGALGLVAQVTHTDDMALSEAFDRLLSLAARRFAAQQPEPDSVDLRFPEVATITVRSGAREVLLPALAEPDAPGPVPGRPGAGAKGNLDLSNIYTTDGLLGDGDGNEIPDRIDGLVVPGPGAEGVPDLTARLGLESTGLTVPLVKPAGDIEQASSEPTSVLVGRDHDLIRELADSGRVEPDSLDAGHGLIELVPRAFGAKPSLVVTGADRDGATLATKRLAEVFPWTHVVADDAPTLDDVEYELWGTLSGHTPAGQAALGLYKLDKILQELESELGDAPPTTVEVTLSVEKPAAELREIVGARARALGAERTSVIIDDRNVQSAATIFDDRFEVPSEVDRFWELFDTRVLPTLPANGPVTLEARLSEPPEVRRAIQEEARRRLVEAGADPAGTVVQVLSAFKQGFSWIRESVAPRIAGADIGEVLIEFRKNEPPSEWPQQSILTPVRWLHEIFPIDEVLAEDLGIEADRVRFAMVEAGPTYRIRVADPGGRELLKESFEPKWVLRPYFDRFRDYEQVRVTTGWLRATAGNEILVDERIVTDPEWVWDHIQESALPAVYDYVMDRHDGSPRGGSQDAPFFGTFTVELELSEPDYRLGVDNEIIAPMDALHEEIYFGTIEFFHLIGRNARGQDLTYPGRIVPVMVPKSDGRPGTGRIHLTGFRTNRPAVVVRYATADGVRGERRLDVPKVAMDRPSLRRAVVSPRSPALARLDFRVRVDSERDEREELLERARAEQVDARMISAEQVVSVLANLEGLRAVGAYASSLAYEEVGEMGVWAEWTHEQDPESRVTAVLPPNGVPEPRPLWSDLVPEGWAWQGERIVQWDTPIPPGEGHEMLAKLAGSSDYATMYRVGQSYLGKTTWAMDLKSPIRATHWSRAKATTFKPTVVYSARQHANEVSSTSHVLRHAELLLADPAQRAKLDRVNVIIHPFTNPDGAQLAYDLYRRTPDYILHAGYLGSLGMDATSGGDDDFPIYPESKVRGRLWERWLPDIFLNPHGYPSHQVVQLFSEYTGLVRRGRVTERNWGFNKGWFMPGFGYIDDPEFPRHKDAAFEIRRYITKGINSNRDVFEMNQRNYARYRRYGAAFDPDVFRLPMTDSVLIEMPLKGSRGGGGGGGGGFNPRVTIWSGTTEAPDETAHGPWMELVAKAGLSWDQAILDYLNEGRHEVRRSGSTFFGGVTLKMNRPRPPEEPDDDDVVVVPDSASNQAATRSR